MVDTQKLKAAIAYQNMSQRKVAKELKMADETFYRKMKKGIFNSNEITKMIDLLNIENPLEVFFAQKVS